MAHPLKDPSQWIPKDLFLAYAGAESSDRLAVFYDRAQARKNLFITSLNWLALLLFPAWLGYRRQWALFGVYTALFALLPLLELQFGFSVPSGAFIGVGLALGLHAEAFLLMSANGLYLKLSKSGLSEDEIAARLRGRARASVGLALASLAGFVVVVTAVSLLIPPVPRG